MRPNHMTTPARNHQQKSIFFHVGRTERSVSDSFDVMSDMLRSVRPTLSDLHLNQSVGQQSENSLSLIDDTL